MPNSISGFMRLPFLVAGEIGHFIYRKSTICFHGWGVTFLKKKGESLDTKCSVNRNGGGGPANSMHSVGGQRLSVSGQLNSEEFAELMAPALECFVKSINKGIVRGGQQVELDELLRRSIRKSSVLEEIEPCLLKRKDRSSARLNATKVDDGSLR